MTIATYIQLDLESRIRGGSDLPPKLTLSALADHYGVSLTPVREAVDDLLERGVLLKGKNRRLAINPREVGRGAQRLMPARPEAPPNWDDVLMQYVLLESLRGEPVFLREEALAARFGIGRTLLRRIFSRLSGTGVLEHVPRRGWRIRPFNDEDLSAYLEVRETLELKALDLARPHCRREDLMRMLAGNQPDDDGVVRRLDNHLHHYFIKKSKNRYIRDFFAKYGGYFRALFDYAALGASVIDEMAAQHRAILQSVLDRDWDTARAALSEHILAQGPVVKQVIKLLEEEPERLLKIAPAPEPITVKAIETKELDGAAR
jgi:DNA-binding GntR family transcriptional regulator